MRTALAVIAGIASFAAGVLVAFFSAGVGLFADGDFVERLPLLGVAFAGCFAIGLVGGLVLPDARWPAVACASGSIPVVLVFGEIGSAPMAALAAAFVALSFVGALLGRSAGVAVAQGRSAGGRRP